MVFWKCLSACGLVRRTRANEWLKLGSRPFRLYMILLENWLFSLAEAYRPRETKAWRAAAPFHDQPNFADLVASKSADRECFPDIFRGLTISCSFFFAQELQEGNFTGANAPVAKPDRSCHTRAECPLHTHERWNLIFFRVGSPDLRVGHRKLVTRYVRSLANWHFPLCYRSTRPCPMGFFTFWLLVFS